MKNFEEIHKILTTPNTIREREEAIIDYIKNRERSLYKKLVEFETELYPLIYINKYVYISIRKKYCDTFSVFIPKHRKKGKRSFILK